MVQKTTTKPKTKITPPERFKGSDLSLRTLIRQEGGVGGLHNPDVRGQSHEPNS